MPYSNLPHPVAFAVPHPRRPPLFSFAASSFHSLSLSLSPFALAPSPGAMTLGYTWRKGRRGKGRERDTVDTVGSGPTKHEFSIKFNTRRKRMLGRCMMLFQGDRAKRGTKKEIKWARGKVRMRDGGTTRTTAAADIILGSSSPEHYQFRRVSIHEILMLQGSLLLQSTPFPAPFSFYLASVYPSVHLFRSFSLSLA